jgi:CheY-like chemotaxis protein/Tfp pilus assembly protein PilZ
MANWRVLVADDESYVLLAIRQVLQTLPASVIEAPDGEQAIRLAKEKRPDLVILDIGMPRMDGFQVAEALKRDAATANMPVMFLSSLGASYEKVRGLKLGAEDYLAKPIDPEELKIRVRRILERRCPLELEAPPASGQSKAPNLPALVRMLEKDRRSVRLIVTRGTERGEIIFVDGQITQAVQGARGGEMAVFHLLTWQDATYEQDPYDPAIQVGGGVAAPNQVLLTEGARRLEEIPALRGRLGDPKRLLDVPASLHAAVQQQSRPEGAMLVALLDGTRDLDQVLADSPFDAWTTLKVLHRLLAVGALEPPVPGSDRRGGPRLKAEGPIEYRVVRSPQTAATFNLSTWGVFIRTATPNEVGERLLLRFPLPDREDRLKIMGQVIWRNADPSKWGGAGMGVKFLDLLPADYDAIERYLAQVIATQIRVAWERA